MKTIHLLPKVFAFWFAAVCLFANNVGAGAQEITMSGMSMPFDSTELKTTVQLEPSAVLPIFNGAYFLVADDERAELLIVEAANGKVRKETLKIPGVTTKQDWEGMAREGDQFYLVNSRGSLYQFATNQDSDPAKPFTIKSHDKFTITELKSGSEIEGLAVWVRGGVTEFVLGIREDNSEVIRVCSGVVGKGKEIALKPFFQFQARKLVLLKSQTEYWHLSSIEYVPSQKGFLIITSTENGGTFFGSKLWFARDQDTPATTGNYTDITKNILEGALFEPTMKAEGLAVLKSDISTPGLEKLVIVFDNDPGKRPALAFTNICIPKPTVKCI